MLKFYYSGAPNPTKVALFLEEAGLPYEAIPVDTRKGDQHKPEYLAINPNAKCRRSSMATSRCSIQTPFCCISPRRPESSCREGRQGARRIVVVADVRGVRRRPVFGPVGAFPHLCARKIEYALNRYAYEAQRHFGILDARSPSRNTCLGTPTRSSIWMSWGWARLIPTVLGEAAWAKFPNLKRLVDEISARPAAQRAVALKDKHKFKAEMDDEARKAMFRHLTKKVA